MVFQLHVSSAQYTCCLRRSIECLSDQSTLTAIIHLGLSIKLGNPLLGRSQASGRVPRPLVARLLDVRGARSHVRDPILRISSQLPFTWREKKTLFNRRLAVLRIRILLGAREKQAVPRESKVTGH